MCKLLGRFLRGPVKERHDQGGFFEALGSLYKREKAKKKKREAESRGEHKSLEDEKGVQLYFQNSSYDHVGKLLRILDLLNKADLQ